MSPDPAPGTPATPPRVLTLEYASAESPMAQALSEAGYSVDTVARPGDLAGALERGAYDAIVLDLSPRGTAEEVIGAAGDVLAGLQSVPRDGRPAVIAVWPSRGRGDRAALLRVDVTIGTRSTEQMLREVEGALAARRLAQALEENDRLRRTVVFARQTAHDLAQPLTTILARAQLMRNSLKEGDPHLRSVSIICDEADRLAQMMEAFQKLKEMSGSRRKA